MTTNIKIIPTAEYDAVIATVQAYIDGLRTGKADELAQAFSDDAVMYGFTDGVPMAGPISNLYDFVNDNGTAPEIATRVDIIGITPTTAVVKVDMENDAIGADYTDFHTLLKQDGQWKIIAKVYHQYEG
ncbi:nuclear transport factor 2 family protein [Rhodococcus sp. IEGM 1409]|uniref:nuclear transport factor 2 family protein n=1 Tax=Rhodococcus sp. IEGM 1409 TaxID=3047082 RepID=UPI0024B7124D|nr:nuclear transport factor 2 family protein [Rhodococcus sp. IEGM 1409]MDI9900486.1 nuclear transport factor 2 family protein [Rhodococcus sp. IEGM 1409]